MCTICTFRRSARFHTLQRQGNRADPLLRQAVYGSGLAQSLANKVGPKPVLAVGMALLAAGRILFTTIPTRGHFASDLLPGFVVVAAGGSGDLQGQSSAFARRTSQYARCRWRLARGAHDAAS
jgi:hypothetical protein